jgi:hypothetical protein
VGSREDPLSVFSSFANIKKLRMLSLRKERWGGKKDFHSPFFLSVFVFFVGSEFTDSNTFPILLT